MLHGKTPATRYSKGSRVWSIVKHQREFVWVHCSEWLLLCLRVQERLRSLCVRWREEAAGSSELSTGNPHLLASDSTATSTAKKRPTKLPQETGVQLQSISRTNDYYYHALCILSDREIWKMSSAWQTVFQETGRSLQTSLNWKTRNADTKNKVLSHLLKAWDESNVSFNVHI